MWLSARETFRAGDAGWKEYIEFIQLLSLTEVRSIDSWLNRYVDALGSIPCDPTDVNQALAALPACSPPTQYYQLAINLSEEKSPPPHPHWTLLGCDFSDETQTSSLLNCGPWLGRLMPFASRLNHYGLLNFVDAKEAQKQLLLEWGDEEPHAHTDIWELYEIVRPV